MVGRIATAAIVLGMLAFPGCLSGGTDPGGSPDEGAAALPQTLPELIHAIKSDGPMAFSLHMDYRDCWLGGVIWFVELAHAQSFLPDGFQASTMEEVLSKDQADVVLDLLAGAGVESVSGRGIILSFQHVCGLSSVDGAPALNSLLWVPVEPSEAGKGVPGTAISESFSLGGGSSGLFRELQLAMKESVFGDEIVVDDWSENPLGPTQQTRLLDGGELVFSVRTGIGVESTPSRNIRVFSTPGAGGLAVLEAATGVEGDRNFLTLDVECEMAPGSILAEAVGGTSCANASKAIPVGVTQPPHHHLPISIYYQPDWTEGPMQISGPVIET